MAQKSILSFFKAPSGSALNNHKEIVDSSPVKKNSKRKINHIESEDENEDTSKVAEKIVNGKCSKKESPTQESCESSVEEKTEDTSSERKKSPKQTPKINSNAKGGKKAKSSSKKGSPVTGTSNKSAVADATKGKSHSNEKSPVAGTSKSNGTDAKSFSKEMSPVPGTSKMSDAELYSAKQVNGKSKEKSPDPAALTSKSSENHDLKQEACSLPLSEKENVNGSSNSAIGVSSSSGNEMVVTPKRLTARKSIVKLPEKCLEGLLAGKKIVENVQYDESSHKKVSYFVKVVDDDEGEQARSSASGSEESPKSSKRSKANCTEPLKREKSPESKTKPKRGRPKKDTPKKQSASIANFFAKDKSSAQLKDVSEHVVEDGTILENSDEKEIKQTKDSINIESQENNSTKTSEKMEMETEESPVKKGTKRKKKAQCIESDEEEVVEPSKKSIKIEAKDENDGEKEKPSEDASTKEKSSSESNVESNSTPSKEKLGLKSTSSGTVYDPSKTHYHPIEDACWKPNENVPYLALAKTLQLIEKISGRLKIVEILANFFRSVIVLSPDDLLHCVYLCLNRLAPEYEGIELGIGETLLMKALAQATGRTLEKIKAEVAIKGDLGLVSESSRGNQRVMFSPPKLTVSSVFSKFLELAKMTGNASMAKKTDKVQSLLVACRDCESKYIIRSLSGKLRIGLAEQSVLAALAQAVVLTPPGQTFPPEILDSSKGLSEKSFKELLTSQTLILKTAYCECPNYDLIIPVLLKEGISGLPKFCQLCPGRPLKPMLAHPTAGIDIVLKRFDKNAFTCEFKYDGERAQIHRTEDGVVKIFSRNQEDNTSKYPDIISRLPKAVKESTKSFILDSEAVAWDRENKQILPFQVLSTRKKKDAVESEIKVQVCIMAFDLLYLNGESLVKKPLKERRSLLHASFNEVDSEFLFAQYMDGNSAETMQEFLDESVKGNCEGLMVKALEVDASYEIAKRSHNWLKLKKDYLQGIGDTLDLVVIGGYFGKGKRVGNYGGFLLACYDNDTDEYQSICKLGTGFKDDVLEAHTNFLKQHVIDKPKSNYRYDHSLEPDVWFNDVQVWEIKCADLSISPVHKAASGIVDPEKGISLRFPRFVRIRDDKKPENATNSMQIADFYRKQEQIQNTTSKMAVPEEDFY